MFCDGKIRRQLGSRYSEYVPLGYEKQMYTKVPREFILYPGEEKLKNPQKSK